MLTTLTVQRLQTTENMEIAQTAPTVATAWKSHGSVAHKTRKIDWMSPMLQTVHHSAGVRRSNAINCRNNTHQEKSAVYENVHGVQDLRGLRERCKSFYRLSETENNFLHLIPRLLNHIYFNFFKISICTRSFISTPAQTFFIYLAHLRRIITSFNSTSQNCTFDAPIS